MEDVYYRVTHGEKIPNAPSDFFLPIPTEIDKEHFRAPMEADDIFVNRAGVVSFTCQVTLSKAEYEKFVQMLSLRLNRQTRYVYSLTNDAMVSKTYTIDCAPNQFVRTSLRSERGSMRRSSNPQTRYIDSGRCSGATDGDADDENDGLTGMQPEPGSYGSLNDRVRRRRPSVLPRWSSKRSRNMHDELEEDDILEIGWGRKRSRFSSVEIRSFGKTCIGYPVEGLIEKGIANPEVDLAATILTSLVAGPVPELPHESEGENEEWAEAFVEPVEHEVPILFLSAPSRPNPAQYFTRSIEAAGPSDYHDFSLPPGPSQPAAAEWHSVPVTFDTRLSLCSTMPPGADNAQLMTYAGNWNI